MTGAGSSGPPPALVVHPGFLAHGAGPADPAEDILSATLRLELDQLFHRLDRRISEAQTAMVGAMLGQRVWSDQQQNQGFGMTLGRVDSGGGGSRADTKRRSECSVLSDGSRQAGHNQHQAIGSSQGQIVLHPGGNPAKLAGDGASPTSRSTAAAQPLTNGTSRHHRELKPSKQQSQVDSKFETESSASRVKPGLFARTSTWFETLDVTAWMSWYSNGSNDGSAPRPPPEEGAGTNPRTRTIDRLPVSRAEQLAAFINTGGFEAFFGAVILTNAMLIGVQTNVEADYGPESKFVVFEVLNMAYTLLFTLELLLRMWAEGKRFFWRSQSFFWNYLDLLIVIFSLLETGIELLIRANSWGSHTTGQFRILRIIRITRLIKVIRITRIIRFIRALRTMVHQLASTLKSLMWAMILLALIIYVFAILMTQSCIDEVHNEDFHGDRETLIDHWSSLPVSMLSLFMSVTGGVSWEDIMTPLRDVGVTPVAFFLVYISFTQLAVLNVLTGVFCQSAIESAQHDHDLTTQMMLDNKHLYVNKLKAIFHSLDSDDSGHVTPAEFAEHFNDEEVQAYLETLELDTSDAKALFKLMDLDGTETIEVDEFVEGCLRLKGGASNLNMAKLSRSQDVLSLRMRRFVTRTDEALENIMNLIREPRTVWHSHVPRSEPGSPPPERSMAGRLPIPPVRPSVVPPSSASMAGETYHDQNEGASGFSATDDNHRPVVSFDTSRDDPPSAV